MLQVQLFTCLLLYYVGRCVVEEADAPSPTVYLSSTILGGGGGGNSARRGDSLP